MDPKWSSGEGSGAAAGGDESAFVAALRRGDERAYARLVAEQGGRMLAVARRVLGNEEEARDAVQEAFVSAYRALDRFAGQSRLSTWLHRIVVNCCLMKLRTRRAHPEESLDDLLPTFREDGHQIHPARSWETDAETLCARAEVRAKVREAIGRLPENHRTVLVLRDLEELDTGEVAALLGVTANAVKIRLHRARQALRELLDRELGPGGALR